MSDLAKAVFKARSATGLHRSAGADRYVRPRLPSCVRLAEVCRAGGGPV